MTRMIVSWLALAALAVPSVVMADTWTVTAIRYEGNLATRDVVLARELAFAVGDPLDADALAHSHQAIIDLALFREVEVSHEPHDTGTVVTVRVREKRYLLPLPRIDGDSDGGHSLGVQLRWNNFLGLNHTLDARFLSGDRDDRIAASEDVVELSYDAPYLFDEMWGLTTAVEHVRRDAIGPTGVFDERLDRWELRILQDRRHDRPRTGWVLGAGFAWQQQHTAGPLAPPADGMATALVFTARHSDLRFHLYSETGSVFDARIETAGDGLLSDYSYSRIDTEYRRHIGLPGGPHRNLNLIAAAGWSNGGSDWRNVFSIGGTSRLRGYEKDFIEGGSYGYAGVEWLRPLGHNWLRFLALAEAGGTSRSTNAAPDGGPYASVGVGLRIRLPWFVGVELEFGVAQPLLDGDGPRFFAGSVR